MNRFCPPPPQQQPTLSYSSVFILLLTMDSFAQLLYTVVAPDLKWTKMLMDVKKLIQPIQTTTVYFTFLKDLLMVCYALLQGDEGWL